MVYMLRVRVSDKDPWGEATAYDTKRERDHDERINRCLGGLRTHSWKESKREEQERIEREARP